MRTRTSRKTSINATINSDSSPRNPIPYESFLSLPAAHAHAPSRLPHPTHSIPRVFPGLVSRRRMATTSATMCSTSGSVAPRCMGKQSGSSRTTRASSTNISARGVACPETLRPKAGVRRGSIPQRRGRFTGRGSHVTTHAALLGDQEVRSGPVRVSHPNATEAKTCLARRDFPDRGLPRFRVKRIGQRQGRRGRHPEACLWRCERGDVLRAEGHTIAKSREPTDQTSHEVGVVS